MKRGHNFSHLVKSASFFSGKQQLPHFSLQHLSNSIVSQHLHVAIWIKKSVIIEVVKESRIYIYNR